MEVENLSKDQLEDLIKKAQNQIVVVENKKLDDGYLKMFEIAKELGLTALLHKDLKCKAPLIEPNLRRNLGKWST
jgi:hypothetical protein